MINLSAEGGHFESASHGDNGCLSLGELITQLHLYLCFWGDWAQKADACCVTVQPLGSVKTIEVNGWITTNFLFLTGCSRYTTVWILLWQFWGFFIPHWSSILVLCQASVYTAAFSPLMRGGDPAPRVCRLPHFMAQALHSGWTVCRTQRAVPLLFSPCPQAAFKRPLAEEAHLIHWLQRGKQFRLGLYLFQEYDYNGNLRKEGGW